MNVSSHNNNHRSRHANPQYYRRRSSANNNNNNNNSNTSSSTAALTGVIACLSGLDFDHKEELHAIITQLGGKYSGALDAGCGITHLVIDEPEGSVKYRFVQQILADEEKGEDDMMKRWATRLKIVTSGWVEACAREGRRVDEGRFALVSSSQQQQNNKKHFSDDTTNCINDDNTNTHNKQQSSSSVLSLPKEIPKDATLEEACEWFIQQQQQTDPYGLQQNQIFSMHSFLLVGFHSSVHNNVDSKTNTEGVGNVKNNNIINDDDGNHQKHRRLHAKLSTLIRNAGGTIYWEPNELTTIVLINDDVDNIDQVEDFNQQQFHHRHQERLLTFQEAKAYCQYHPRGPIAVTPRWILACIHRDSILDFPSSFPSPPPIPIPSMIPVSTKRKASAVVDFAVDNVKKHGKDVKKSSSALSSTAKDTSINFDKKPKQRKYKQSTIFQGDIFVVIRPQQLPSSSLDASLEYTQDEMERKITHAGGLILSKRILEAVKKDVVRKQQEYAIQQRKRRNNDDSNIAATNNNNDDKRRYYVVSSGGHSNVHHSKYHPLLGELSKILQQSSQLGNSNKTTDLSSIIEPVSPVWVTACIQEGYVYNPIQYPKLFQPQTYHLRLFPKDTKFLVSVTGFVDASRYGIIWMLRSLGAEYTDSLKAKNTHLICCTTVNDENNNRNVVGGGPKYIKAKEWGLHVVTLDWLYHCMRYGYEDGSEEKFLATRIEDQPKTNIKKEEKKGSDNIDVRCSMDTIKVTNETVHEDTAVSKSTTEATAAAITATATAAVKTAATTAATTTATTTATTAATTTTARESPSNIDTPSMSDDESSSTRRGKRDRKLPQASPIDNDSGKRFKSALQTLQSTPTVGTTASSSSSRRRRGKRDRSPRTNSSQASQQGENDGNGGSPSLLSQQSQESDYPQAETQFTIRADADIGKHWTASSGFDDDEAPMSQVNEAEDNGESQVVWLPFMRR